MDPEQGAVEPHGEIEAQSPTRRQRLDAAESLWIWKFGLRAALIIIDIIGIGLVGWALSQSINNAFVSDWYVLDEYTVPWGLITFGLSFIFCLICILVLLLRSRPVHPGVAVGLDLILWLAFIVTVMTTVFAAIETSQFGQDGSIEASGYSGDQGSYVLQPNGTWVYTPEESYAGSPYYGDGLYKRATTTVTSSSASASSTSSYDPNDPYGDDPNDPYGDDPYGDDPNGDDPYDDPNDPDGTDPDEPTPTSTSTPTETARSCELFSSCAAEDAAVNHAWHFRNHALSVEWAAVVFQSLALLLHFVLFVWACCDTHQRRKRDRKFNRTDSDVHREAERIAESIVRGLRQRGELVSAAPQAQPLLRSGDPAHGTEMTERSATATPVSARPRVSAVDAEPREYYAPQGEIREV